MPRFVNPLLLRLVCGDEIPRAGGMWKTVAAELEKGRRGGKVWDVSNRVERGHFGEECFQRRIR